MNGELSIQIENVLSPLLVDPGMLTGIDDCKVEVAKRAFELHLKFEDDPASVNPEDVEKILNSEGSQIGNKDAYLNHVKNVGSIYKNLAEQLQSRNLNLPLPKPEVAYATGLLHDLNATYSNYSVGGQQSKEIDEFLLAEKHGWPRMANHTALHSGYTGIIKLLAEDHPLPNPKFEPAYVEMRKLFKGDSDLSYQAIIKRFEGYLKGKDNYTLMLLTVVDSIENGQNQFNVETVDEDFKFRSGDLANRYYHKPLSEGKAPSFLGISLVEGRAIERIKGYQKKVSSWLSD